MNNLEMRKLESNILIGHEMEECYEILFVDSGRYSVGYEINKRKYFKRQFGQSTNIGGFEICYYKRFMFFILAVT